MPYFFIGTSLVSPSTNLSLLSMVAKKSLAMDKMALIANTMP